MESRIQNSVEAQPQYIDQVFQLLLDSIVLGELQPGQRVRQSELADRLGVSRQPVSHALQLLKQQGLVREAGKQGVEVAPIDLEHIVHLYRARTALEGMAVMLATRRVRDKQALPEQTNELQLALSVGIEACSAANPTLPALVKADARFHNALYRLSDNPVIEQMMSAQWPHLMRSMMATYLDEGDVLTRAWEEHGLIAPAVLAGDVGEAQELITKHLERAGSDAHRRLRVVLDPKRAAQPVMDRQPPKASAAARNGRV